MKHLQKKKITFIYFFFVFYFFFFIIIIICLFLILYIIFTDCPEIEKVAFLKVLTEYGLYLI